MREYFSGGITMTVTDGCFRLSTDSMVLADFCRLPRGAAVCDLGSGCGALGLLLLRDHPDMRVTGLEILPDAAAQARKNIDANHLSEHFSVITGDLRGHRTLLPASAFDAVVSNPPYFPAASGAISPDGARAIARSEVCCTIDDLCACAAYALRFGGEFFLVHKPERLTDLLCTLRAHRAGAETHPPRAAPRGCRREPRADRGTARREAGRDAGAGAAALHARRAGDHRLSTNLSPSGGLTMAGMLYLVPTPIGNLGDISVRCRKTLAEADFIAAEDTRVTLKLLNYLELKKTLVSYYEHNKAESGPRIVARILAGETCVLVSDAGSPAISDPGEDLVRLCAEAGITVCAIPGPCAVITALSISGLPTGRFCFEGFLSINKKSRREHLAGLKDERRTMIFYEAPHKLVNTLEDLAGAFGAERRISLCRELTKLHEEVVRTTLGEAAARYRETPPKGEFVLVVEGAAEAAAEAVTPEDAVARVQALMAEGLSKKDAVKQAAKETGTARNALYDLVLQTL